MAACGQNKPACRRRYEENGVKVRIEQQLGTSQGYDGKEKASLLDCRLPQILRLSQTCGVRGSLGISQDLAYRRRKYFSREVTSVGKRTGAFMYRVLLIISCLQCMKHRRLPVQIVEESFIGSERRNSTTLLKGIDMCVAFTTA